MPVVALAGCTILLFASIAKREPAPSTSSGQALSEVEEVGISTSPVENQNRNGLRLVESHLSQRTQTSICQAPTKFRAMILFSGAENMPGFLFTFQNSKMGTLVPVIGTGRGDI